MDGQSMFVVECRFARGTSKDALPAHCSIDEKVGKFDDLDR